MPSVVKQNLNQLIQAIGTPAELVLGAPWVFAGLALDNLTAPVYITGLIWSANVEPADRANARLVLSLERGLALTATTSLPAAQDVEEMIIQYVDAERMRGMKFFVDPLRLDAGYSYALTLSMAVFGGFANNTTLRLTVLGQPASQQGRAPIVLR